MHVLILPELRNIKSLVWCARTKLNQAFMCAGRGPSPDQPVGGGDGDDDQHALRRQPQPPVRAQGDQAGRSPAAEHDRRGARHAGTARDETRDTIGGVSPHVALKFETMHIYIMRQSERAGAL